MFRKEKKSFIKRIIFNQRSVALLGLILIVLISFPLARNISQRYAVGNDIKELDKEIGELEKKNTNLKQLIDYIGSDQFVSEQARLNLGLKKDGEKVFVVNSATSADSMVGGQAEASQIYKIEGMKKDEVHSYDNVVRWWRYFFE